MSVRLALDRFRNVVVKESKTALTKKGKNVSKELYNSIDSELKVSKNSFELSFVMAKHGKFINDGVKGVKKDKTDNSGLKIGDRKFSYKAGVENRPPTRVFDKWVIKRGLAGRNKKGQFVSRESLKFAIATHVQNVGLETTNFFTKPFENAFKNLPDELVEAYGLEVESLLKSVL
jgi:hypothetical protein